MRRVRARAIKLAFAVSFTAAFVACGAIAPGSDAGVELDATMDVAEAAVVDTTNDTASPDASIDANVSDLMPDAASLDAGSDVAEVYFDATPDPVGCTYFSDASCTTIPKPVSISIAGCVPSPPPQDGGVIEPGVYHLTSAYWNAQFFDGGCPANATWGGSLEICGNIIQDYDVNDVHSVFVGNLIYQTVGNQLQWEQYCPSGPYFASFAYTATPTQIVINWGYPSVGLIETYTKQ
ncbi:MAG TPA: hypothetical protein VGH28_02335 [Polyangiaceae bacterium]|jgi:hypothetical protein